MLSVDVSIGNGQKSIGNLQRLIIEGLLFASGNLLMA
jgi:hypothetical protein